MEKKVRLLLSDASAYEVIDKLKAAGCQELQTEEEALAAQKEGKEVLTLLLAPWEAPRGEWGTGYTVGPPLQNLPPFTPGGKAWRVWLALPPGTKIGWMEGRYILTIPQN